MSTTTATETATGRLRLLVEYVSDHPDRAVEAYRRYLARLPDDARKLADDPEAEALLAMLAETGSGWKAKAEAIRRAVRAARSAAPLRVVTEDDAGEAVDVRGMATVPNGYSVTEAGVHRMTDPPQLVAWDPIGVTGVARDEATGAEHVTLTWRRFGRWHSRIVSRAITRDARKLCALAGDGVPVDSNTASALVAYLSACEAVGGVSVDAATSTMGWQRTGGYQWGARTIGGEQVQVVVEDGAQQLVEGFTSSGDPVEWTGVWRNIEDHPRLVIAVYAAVSAALLGVIPEAKSYVIDYAGRSSTGKSSAMELAASVWGRPSVLMSTWNGTHAAIEAHAALMTHLPTFLDDTKQAKSPELVTSVIYDVCSDRGKSRGKIDGLRRTSSLRTVLFSTGERPATSHGQHAGAYARTITMQGMVMVGGDRPDNRRLAEWLHSRCAEVYGHLGPAVVAWLAARRETWPDLVAEWRGIKARYAPERIDSGFLGRAAGHLALLELAGVVVERACGYRLRADAIEEAGRCAEASAADADRAKAAMLDLLSYVAGRNVDLMRTYMHEGNLRDSPEPDRAIGRWDEGGNVGVLHHVARKALAEAGHAIEDVLGTWGERGWLVRTGSEWRWQARITIGGDKVRLLGITPKGLTESGWQS